VAILRFHLSLQQVAAEANQTDQAAQRSLVEAEVADQATKAVVVVAQAVAAELDLPQEHIQIPTDREPLASQGREMAAVMDITAGPEVTAAAVQD
jgi:hypothetical protein